VNCISDRQQGACHYTIDGHTPGAPPNCGNWFVWYRLPIQNDPDVAANIAAASIAAETGGSTGSTSTGGPQVPSGSTSTDGGSQNLLYIGLAFLAGFVVVSLMSGDEK
jgi:hypothetical protein